MHPQLSPRQSDVLRLLLRGKSDKEIANELGLALGTIKVHRLLVYAKYGVRTDRALMAKVWSEQS